MAAKNRTYYVRGTLDAFHGKEHERYVRNEVIPALRSAFPSILRLSEELPIHFDAEFTPDFTVEQKCAIFDFIDTGASYGGVTWEEE